MFSVPHWRFVIGRVPDGREERIVSEPNPLQQKRHEFLHRPKPAYFVARQSRNQNVQRLTAFAASYFSHKEKEDGILLHAWRKTVSLPAVGAWCFFVNCRAAGFRQASNLFSEFLWDGCVTLQSGARATPGGSPSASAMEPPSRSAPASQTYSTPNR